MKTAEDKAKLKNHFFKLGQGRVIPIDDLRYWRYFWEEPESSSDVFDLNINDIKNVRDQNKVNFVIFMRILTERIILNKDRPRHLLNCMRYLTRLLPFLYELEDYPTIENILWNSIFEPMRVIQNTVNAESNDNLASDLTRTLVTLLFTPEFTVTHKLSLWEPGIGSTSKYSPPDLKFDANRAEVLKLVLTLISTSSYEPAAQIISKGSKFLTILVTATPRTEILTLLCSLTNLICRSARSSPEENVLCFPNQPQLTEVRHLLVTLSIQLLTTMIAYPLPKSKNTKAYNMVRLYMGKLHKESELLYLGSSLLNILKSPLGEAQFTFKSNPPSLWAVETIMLIWELLQCNKHFRILFVQNFLNELLICLLYNVFAYNSSHKQLSRISSQLMLFISSEEDLTDLTLAPINPESYDSLPSNFKLTPRPTTTRDFLVTHLTKIPDTNTIEILYNFIPPVSKTLEGTNELFKNLTNSNPGGGLSYAASWAITQLIAKFSSRAFLQEKAHHSDLLALLMRAVCTAIVKHPIPSRMLLFAIYKNEKVYEQVLTNINTFELEYFQGGVLVSKKEDLTREDSMSDTVSRYTLTRVDSTLSRVDSRDPPSRNLSRANSETSIGSETVARPMNVITEGITTEAVEGDSDSEVIEASLRPKPLTGMSENSREKLPMESSLKRSWTGNESLRIILNIVIPELKLIFPKDASVESFVLVKNIEAIDFEAIFQENKSHINFDFLPQNPFQRLRFHWSHLSLGWYMSLLYGEMYANHAKNFTGNNNRLMHNITSSFALVGKFTSGWTSFMKPTHEAIRNEKVVEYVGNSLTTVNQWGGTSIRLFKVDKNDGMFKLGGGVDMASHLVKRLSDFRVNNGSRPSLADDRRGSVSSLHSLNTLNRTRSNTPRNSIAE